MNTNVTILFLLLLLFGCVSHEPALQTSQRIIFFGDSITELGVKPDGYVTIIRETTASLGRPLDVIGAGISGNKIGDLLARADRDVISKRPAIVVVYIGINDVWHYAFASRGLTGTPKEQFAAGLAELTVRLRDAGARVVLCTPTVIGEKTNGANRYDAMLDEYSGITRMTAASTGSALCDLREAFRNHLQSNNPADAEKDILTYDGVHLNTAGNRLVAERILSVLDGMGIYFPEK